MSNEKEKRQILFELGKEAVLINCHLFREKAGDFAIELLKMHKDLFPELYEEKCPQCGGTLTTIDETRKECSECECIVQRDIGDLFDPLK